MSPRRLEVDLLKAAGIVAVVLIHSLRPYFSPDVARSELALARSLSFAVPGFMLASGLLYATAAPVAWPVTRKRLVRLLVPYAVASVAVHAARALLDGIPLSATALLRDLAAASAFGPFYYVLHAVLFVLLAPVLARLGPRPLAVLVAASVAAQWLWWVAPPRLLSPFWVVRNPLHWLAFFGVGWWLGTRLPAATRWLAERRLPASLLCALAALGAAGLAVGSASWSLGQAASSLNVWCVLLALAALGLGRETPSRTLRFLSDSTYSIYLFHLFFVGGVQRFLTPAPRVFDAVAIGCAWLAGLLGPLLLAAAGRALLGARSRMLLGS
jgi:fucose 4-O-acetylase-like acetyltransferase